MKHTWTKRRIEHTDDVHEFCSVCKEELDDLNVDEQCPGEEGLRNG